MSDGSSRFDWMGAAIALGTAGALGWLLDSLFPGMNDGAWAAPLFLAWLFILGMHLRRRHRAADPPGLTSGEMAAARLTELEDRLAELESRIEFSERLLTHGGSEQTVSADDEHAR